MAVIVQTDNPKKLLDAIVSAIRDGSVETWRIDSDGDFTHSPEQWRSKAWFRPRVVDNGLRFNILTPRGTNMSRAVYGVYHGRFVEMMLSHFDLLFNRTSVTALPTANDVVQSNDTSRV